MKKEKLDFYSHDVFKIYDLPEEMRYQLKILDTLDAFTRKHSENVAMLTSRMCKEMGMDQGFTNYCTICAYLHDIGKIFIPPKVLQKNGKLTEDEFEIMKTHATIGYNICHADLKLRPYEAGALYHHEAMDGTGYPKGLVGNEIVIEGQIIRVADEFDAISSKRQYKTHIGTLDTLKILIENSKPTEKSKRQPGLFSKKIGKNNPKIVKVLIKVISYDVENEIFYRQEHLRHLKNEEDRYKKALKMYNKSKKAKKDADKEYYRQYTKGYLVTGEDIDKVEGYLEDVKVTYEAKVIELDKLKYEFKEIKRLRV